MNAKLVFWSTIGFVLVVGLIFSPTQIFAQDPNDPVPFDPFNPQQSNCFNAAEAYFGIGDQVQLLSTWVDMGVYARVTPSTPGGDYIPQIIQNPNPMQVLAGPVCYADGTRYWLFQITPGTTGWMSDGLHIPGAPASILYFSVLGVTGVGTEGIQTTTGGTGSTTTSGGPISPPPSQLENYVSSTCENAVPIFLEIGDVVVIAPEARPAGFRLVPDVPAGINEPFGAVLSDEELLVFDGPFCDYEDHVRYWLVQNLRYPDQMGWISDGWNFINQTLYILIKVRHETIATVPGGPIGGQGGAVPDGMCSPYVLPMFSVGSIVEPSRDDVRIYDQGLWVRDTWYQWEWGYLTIIGGPVCHKGNIFWQVYDDVYGISGWVIEWYDNRPNIALSNGNFRAEQGAGYSATLQGNVPQ